VGTVGVNIGAVMSFVDDCFQRTAQDSMRMAVEQGRRLARLQRNHQCPQEQRIVPSRPQSLPLAPFAPLSSNPCSWCVHFTCLKTAASINCYCVIFTQEYCSFGGPVDDHMDSARFAKLCKVPDSFSYHLVVGFDAELNDSGLCALQECELTDTYCTAQDVDVIFTKVKPHGGRKITFRDFEHALTLVGAKKFPELDPVSGYYYTVDMVIAHGGPEARATVRPLLFGGLVVV
jgi:hypothetical protein